MPKREEIKKIVALNNKGYAGVGLSQKTLHDLDSFVGDYIKYVIDYDDNLKVKRISLERI